MSILINGAKLPKSCFGCHLFKLDDKDLWCIANHYAGYCRVLSKYIDENKFVNERHPNCPLIEVKTPHGRLIDADALLNKTICNPLWSPYITKKMVLDAKTVIEAEGET